MRAPNVIPAPAREGRRKNGGDPVTPIVSREPLARTARLRVGKCKKTCGDFLLHGGLPRSPPLYRAFDARRGDDVAAASISGPKACWVSLHLSLSERSFRLTPRVGPRIDPSFVPIVCETPLIRPEFLRFAYCGLRVLVAARDSSGSRNCFCCERV